MGCFAINLKYQWFKVCLFEINQRMVGFSISASHQASIQFKFAESIWIRIENFNQQNLEDKLSFKKNVINVDIAINVDWTKCTIMIMFALHVNYKLSAAYTLNWILFLIVEEWLLLILASICPPSFSDVFLTCTFASAAHTHTHSI